MFEGKKIFILGMARSGYEVAKLLSKYNNDITLVTSKKENNDHEDELIKLGVKVIIDTNQADHLDETFDCVIKNPGISLTSPVVEKAGYLNIPVTNEVEVAYYFKPKGVKIIGITGSLGKTTTTTIIYELLKNNYKTHLGGNIGLPVSALVEESSENDIWVLEISGHQLHDTINFKCDMAVLVNLSEVHLDHFGTYENYKNQKLKIFNSMNESNIAVINKDNVDSVIGTNSINATKLYFSSKEVADCYLDDTNIVYKGEVILNTKNLLLKGMHNYENMMMGIIIAKQFNIPNEDIRETLVNFKGVEHRIEFVRNINGIDFYNDSKSTHPGSTVTALKTFNTSIVLILGGMERNEDLSELDDYLSNVKVIVSYGATKDKVREYADKHNILCFVGEDTKDIVNLAYENSKVGDTVLFSPAHASWGQFEDFEERGRVFKEEVNKLV